MTFPRYPKYKDSGVRWLGEVPDHWDLKRLGHCFQEQREKVSDKQFPPLSVTKNGVVPQLETAAKSDDADNRKRVDVGDFVINSRSDRKGSSGISSLEGSVSLICTVLKSRERLEERYVHHLLRSEPFQEEFYRNGKGIVADLWSTNYSEMQGIILAVPSLPEQLLVARFLDDETAKIDKLVAEQRRLIDLLNEKRQAVISHAVTKGLNPDAPLKDSGIRWMGQIPKDWKVVPLGKLALSRCDGPFGSGLRSEHYSMSGVRVIRLQNLRNMMFDNADAVFIDTDYYEKALSGHEVVAGDVLVAGLGDDKHRVGRACVAPVGIEPAMVKADCFRFRIDPNVALPEFVAIALSAGAEPDAGKMSSGSTRSRIPLSTMATRKVALPPLDHQRKIMVFVQQQVRKFGALITEAEKAIVLLLERRAALISSVVTGQVDIRRVVAHDIASMAVVG